MSNTERGRIGERVAGQYLRTHAYTIHLENWRCPHGEIDIIAQSDDTLIFVEVKARTSNRFGSPEEALTPHKQQRLLRLAQIYLAEADLHDVAWRIDVIAIYLTTANKVRRITHYKSAVQAGW